MASLFFSYSHHDEELRNELETHLALLKRQGIVSSWHDRRITAGSHLHEEIDANLESADVVLLLVSAHFLASDYCYEREMQRALEREKAGTAIVIPVILQPCDWQSAPFGYLRATPTDGRPVSLFANQHEAFAIVAKDVRAALESKGPVASIQDRQGPTPAQVGSAIRSSNLRIKKKFDDHQRDAFLEDSFEYIARLFDGSLQELSDRNPAIKTRFKRLSATSFAAYIYDDGKRAANCAVWYGGETFGSRGILYSESPEAPGNSYNEALHVEDDGYALHLKPMGMPMHGGNNELLSQQGAAEYYWGLLIRHLQS